MDFFSELIRFCNQYASVSVDYQKEKYIVYTLPYIPSLRFHNMHETYCIINNMLNKKL